MQPLCGVVQPYSSHQGSLEWVSSYTGCFSEIHLLHQRLWLELAGWLSETLACLWSLWCGDFFRRWPLGSIPGAVTPTGSNTLTEQSGSLSGGFTPPEPAINTTGDLVSWWSLTQGGKKAIVSFAGCTATVHIEEKVKQEEAVFNNSQFDQKGFYEITNTWISTWGQSENWKMSLLKLQKLKLLWHNLSQIFGCWLKENHSNKCLL